MKTTLALLALQAQQQVSFDINEFGGSVYTEISGLFLVFFVPAFCAMALYAWLRNRWPKDPFAAPQRRLDAQ